MDIVKQIDQHTKNLVDGLVSSSLEQRKSLAISILGFYYQLPKFEETIHKYIGIKVKRNQLFLDIINGHIENYLETIEKSNVAIDVYADTYEEPEPIEIFMLDAFASGTSDLKFTTKIVALFIGIIDTLDYYENFSDRPEFWNNLLEKEVEFQKEVLIQLGSKQAFDASMYQKRYKNVNFDEL
jgi:hypothetical protein